MDHHKLAQKLEKGSAPAAGGLHQGIGTINNVDADKHTVNMTHEPITSLNWPKMKMQFTVDQAVDLSGYQVGDAVSFNLKPVGKDDYTITSLKKGQ